MRLQTLLVFATIAASSLAAHAQTYKPPRDAAGHPVFEGHWTNTSLTVLERPGDLRNLVITEAEAKRAAQMRNQYNADDSAPTDPNAPPPKAGSDVGGYNAFWIDTGTSYAKVGGEYRSSWLIDPPNGKLPYSPAGQKTFQSSFAQQRNANTDPEVRSLGERCLLGFGSSAGPPMLNVSYNNHYQIVQTGDDVLIFAEMIHDARIIRMKGSHQPASMTRWMGDSIGRWDGDTLVIETTNTHPQESMRIYYGQSLYISKDAKITERLTRIADNQLLYAFEVDDPSIYSQTWRAEMVFNTATEPSYEYACHEGNYSMPGILSGGRKEEAAARAKAKKR